MGVFQNHLMAAAVAKAAESTDFYTHQIANSVRMSDSGNSTLKITAGTPTSSKTFTYSWWWKRWDVTSTATQSTNVFTAGTSGAAYSFWTFTNGSTPQANFNFTGGNFVDSRLTTNMLFRDPSAWYHCVLRFDSTQAASANRVRLYVNGVEPTYSSATVQTDLAQDEDVSFINESGVLQGWGGLSGKGTTAEGCDVYMAEIVFNDGQSYGPDSYGETKNGVWIPKDPSGLTFGNNGYYLKFESSGDLGNDSSGNNNDFTASGLAAHDQMLDSPTFDSSSNGGNFATLNPLASLAGVTFSEGNLKEADDNSGWQAMWSTMAVPSGKYYFEAEFTEGSRDRGYIGVAQSIDLATYQDSYYAGQTNNSAGWYSANGSVYINASTTGSTLNTYTTDDIVGCAIDIDNGYVYFSKNGTWEDSGDPTSGATGTGGFSLSASTSGDSWHLIVSGWGSEFIVNYGQDPSFAGSITAGTAAPDNGLGLFKYDVPADYKALCAGNLPTPAADPAEDEGPQNYFNAVTYTGSGGTQTISGVGFQPDMNIVKNRGAGSTAPCVQDSSRGEAATDDYYYLRTSGTTVQENTTDFKSFESDGFEIGGTGSFFNASGNTFVSLNWKANGGTTAANTTGDIDSTVQVDADRGFSIIQYTGSGTADDTVGHGLSDTPDFVIGTPLDSAGSNRVAWCNGMANTAFLKLNTTAAQATSDQIMGVSSTTIAVGGNANLSSKSQLIYCWHNVEGYSRFGSYEGNGNADGTFVYTGFRPALIWTKSIDSTSDWLVFDDKRLGYNVDNNDFAINDTGAEATTDMIDILSNGFKCIIATDPNVAETYIYMAWAHNPFKYATAR